MNNKLQFYIYSITIFVFFFILITYINEKNAYAELIDINNGTVTDSETGLMWQQAGADSAMNWAEALSYCENLNLAGYSDWRLPNRNELQSIVDYSLQTSAISNVAFPETYSSKYWTSSSDAYLTNYAWQVSFDYGDVISYNKSEDCYVRAVRAGQLEDLVMNDLVVSPATGTFPLEVTFFAKVAGFHEPFSFFYSFGDGNSLNESKPQVNHTYNSAGTYEINCTVTDVKGNSAESENRFITIYEPQSFEQLSFSDQSVPAGSELSIEANVTGGKSPYSYLFDFGDGEKETTNQSIVSHTYAETGSYTVKCTAADDLGWTAGKNQTIYVYGPPALYAEPQGFFDSYELKVNEEILTMDTPDWSVSPDSLASVNGSKLKAKSNGRVVITATEGNMTAKIPVYLITEFDDLEMEPYNNQSDGANSLHQGDYLHAEMLEGDTDFFKLTLNQDDVLDLVFLNKSESTDCRISILDNELNTVVQRFSKNGEQKVFRRPLQAGDYFVRVEAAGEVDLNNPYYVGYFLKQEDALTLGQSVQKGLYSGLDEWAFPLHIAKQKDLQIVFNPNGSDLTLDILDDSAAPVLSWSGNSTIEFPIGLYGGNYIIRVRHASLDDGDSVFDLEVSESAEMIEVEPNDQANTGTQLSSGQELHGNLFFEDIDIFRLISDDNACFFNFDLTNQGGGDLVYKILSSTKESLMEKILQPEKSLFLSSGLSQGTYHIELEPGQESDQNVQISYQFTLEETDGLEIEPNNEWNVASPLQIGEEVTASLWDSTDTDVFSFISKQNDGFQFSLNNTANEVGLNLELISPKIEPLLSKTVEAGTDFNLISGLTTGTYYLRISALQNATIYEPKSYEVFVQNTSHVEVEVNDIWQQAVSLPLGQAMHGSLWNIEDRDFWGFSLNVPRYLNLQFEVETTTQDYKLTLYKGDASSPIDSIDSKDGEKVELNVGLTSGDYYLGLEGIGDFAPLNSYILTLKPSQTSNLEIEPNENLKFANALPTNATQQGRISTLNDQDIWGFSLNGTSIFTVSLSSESQNGDYVLSLLNEASTLLAQKECKNGQEITSPWKQKPGNYFLRVESGQDLDPYAFYDLTLTSKTDIKPFKKLVGISMSAGSVFINPDGETQLSVSAYYSDGTSTDITQDLEYVVSDSSVLKVDTHGVVSAQGVNGTATITTTYKQDKSDALVFTVGQAETKQSYGNLVILAGGSLSASDSLKAATKFITDLAYQKFQARNFKDEDIYFMTESKYHDLDGDGYDDQIVDDGSPTVSDLQYILTNWATKQSSDGPLYVYLADHGEKDQFMVATNEILSADQLNSFLDDFQLATDRQAVVIIEACYSGSFVDDLKSDKYERLVLTSVDSENPAYLSTDGTTSFSSFLLTYLYKGNSLTKSLSLTKADLGGVGTPYAEMAPKLFGPDSLKNLQVGGNFVLAKIFPEFIETTQDKTVSVENSMDFSASVSSTVGGLDVWVVIVPPDYSPPSVSQNDFDTPTDKLPKIELVDEDEFNALDGVYKGSFSDFTYNGEYKVTFYAKDGENNLSKSAPVTISVKDGQNISSPTTNIGIDVQTNWNLLGWPFISESTAIGNVLKSVSDQLISCWKWDNNKWSVYLPTMNEQESLEYIANQGFSELIEINCGEGFWINVENNAQLDVNGTIPQDTNVSFSQGWNLLGIKGSETLAINDLIGNETGIVSLWKWSDANWKVFLPGLDDNGTSYAKNMGFGVLKEIAPGEGFWVNSE